MDEHTREPLDTVVARRIDADRTVKALDDIVRPRRSAPEFIRCDNGPELTANALRDWCRFSGTGASFIEPGSPWENPFVEFFASRLRDELLSVEQCDTLLEAQVMVSGWRSEFNNHRPNSGLGWSTPVAYAESCKAEHQMDPLSQGVNR